MVWPSGLSIAHPWNPVFLLLVCVYVVRFAKLSLLSFLPSWSVPFFSFICFIARIAGALFLLLFVCSGYLVHPRINIQFCRVFHRAPPGVCLFRARVWGKESMLALVLVGSRRGEGDGVRRFVCLRESCAAQAAAAAAAVGVSRSGFSRFGEGEGRTR